MSNLITKRCANKNCQYYGQELPVEQFSKSKKSRDGLQSWCKTCLRAAVSDYQKRNLEKERIRGKIWRKANPDKVKQYQRTKQERHGDKKRLADKQRYWNGGGKAKKQDYQKTHPDVYRKAQGNFQRNHPERAKEIRQKFYKTHRDELLQRAKKWREENIEVARAREKAYTKNNPEKVRITNQRRIARLKALPATLTITEWQQILIEWNNCCAYCGRHQSEIQGVLQQDHIIPLVQGGGYTRENLVPACKICNGRKNGRTPEQAGMPLLLYLKQS